MSSEEKWYGFYSDELFRIFGGYEYENPLGEVVLVAFTYPQPDSKTSFENLEPKGEVSKMLKRIPPPTKETLRERLIEREEDEDPELYGEEDG